MNIEKLCNVYNSRVSRTESDKITSTKATLLISGPVIKEIQRGGVVHCNHRVTNGCANY